MTEKEMEDINIQIKYSIDMKDITLNISVPDDHAAITPEQYKKILEFFASRADMEDVFSLESDNSDGEGALRAH